MKKLYVLLVIIIIAVIAYQHWNADEPDSTGGKADRPPQVVMYGTSSCPACKMERINRTLLCVIFGNCSAIRFR